MSSAADRVGIRCGSGASGRSNRRPLT